MSFLDKTALIYEGIQASCIENARRKKERKKERTELDRTEKAGNA